LLKGTLLLRVWDVPLARPTMDIDMLGRITGTPEVLVPIMRECMAIQVEDDGMQFEPENITTEAITWTTTIKVGASGFVAPWVTRT